MLQSHVLGLDPSWKLTGATKTVILCSLQGYIWQCSRKQYVNCQVTANNVSSALGSWSKKWSDEWLLRLNVDKCISVSYCLKHGK